MDEDEVRGNSMQGETALARMDGIGSMMREGVARAEERVEVYKQFVTTAYRLTNARDWVKLGNVYYLQSGGCDKVAEIFGISFGEPKFDMETWETEDGQLDVMYTCSIPVTGLGRQIVAIGCRKLSDPFFVSDRGGTKKRLAQVERHNVKKAAVTNAKNRGLKELMGLQNPTEQQLREAGVEMGSTASVAYKGDSAAASPEVTNEYRALLAPITMDVDEQNDIFRLAAAFLDKETHAVVCPTSPGKVLSKPKWCETTIGNMRALISHEPPPETGEAAIALLKEGLKAKCEAAGGVFVDPL